MCIIELSSKYAELKVLKGVCYIWNDKRVVWSFIEPPYFPLKPCRCMGSPSESLDALSGKYLYAVILPSNFVSALCVWLVLCEIFYRCVIVWEGYSDRSRNGKLQLCIIFAIHPSPSTEVLLLKLLYHRPCGCDCCPVQLSTFPYLGLDNICLWQGSESRSDL